MWTNTCCGHPGPGERMEDAVRRRVGEELGVELADLTCVLPDFSYTAVDASGIMENEICPVYRAVTMDVVQPNPEEVSEFAWLDPHALRGAVTAAPFAFSPWLGWQLEQLGA